MIVAVLAAITLSFAATAFAQDAPGAQNSIIRLGTRVFDLGTNVRRMRRDAHFIPITDVGWINRLVGADPHLVHTVIHINSFSHLLDEPVWLPDTDRENFARADDLARVWGLQDYDVLWRHKVAPSTRGSIVMIPRSPNAGFYVSCGYVRADSVPTFCTARVRYPPDPSLRIKIRVYQITDPLNDFRAIVERALNLVYCLDVTRTLVADGWRSLTTDEPQSLEEYFRASRNISS